MTLTEFLLARITEDEENAQDRIEDSMDNGWPHACRVLAECDAKRRIIAEHRNPEGTPWCLRCVEHDGGETPFPCPTLRALALPYADHPDCREEWRL